MGDKRETRRDKNTRFGQPSPDPPVLNEFELRLMRVFRALSETRSQHANGPNPLQPSDVMAWLIMHRSPLNITGVETLFAMDSAYVRAVNQNLRAEAEERQAEAEKKRKRTPRRSR